MKLLFASDLHGSLSATEKLLEKFEQYQVDWLILLGDLLNHGPRNPLPEQYQPASVAQLLNDYAAKIIAVRGNCDSEVDQMLLNFPIQVSWQQVLIKKCRLFLTHGHLYSPENLPPLSKYDIFVYGHTHIPTIMLSNEIICFNPGSVALPKGDMPASFGLLCDDNLHIMALEDKSVLQKLVLTNLEGFIG